MFVMGSEHAAPMGLNTISPVYPGLTPGATDVPPRWGSFLWLTFLWLRIRIYWICKMGRIYFAFCGWVGDIAPPTGLKREMPFTAGLHPRLLICRPYRAHCEGGIGG